LMKKHHINSILIEDEGLPIGIVTNKDLRDKVITGIHTIDEPSAAIMSFPVLCYPATISMSQAQIAMLKHNVSHLCITEDGTPNTKIIGILSQHDITMMRGSNP